MTSHSGDRKRKHPEPTIRDLFTSQQKPNTGATAPISPTSKRSRLDSSVKDPAAAIKDKDTKEVHALSTANMYHFPSKKLDLQGHVDVVDLSSSPDATPTKSTTPKNGIRKATPNLQANGGPKRMLVKNFKPVRKVDPKTFLDQVWKKVDGALDTIFAQDKIDFSLEELYRGVENLCRQNLAQDACDRLVKKCEDYVKETLREKVMEMMGRKDVDVLRGTLQAWTAWNEQLVS